MAQVYQGLNGPVVVHGSRPIFNREALLEDEPVDLGQGITLILDQKRKFTHKAAEALLNLPEFAGDRPLKNAHVAFLTRQMQDGTFHWEWVEIITCQLKTPQGRVEHRMNGQHTAWARINMPENHNPDSKGCQVRWMTYEAEDEASMRRLYTSIDRNSPRTTGNVYDAILYDTKEFKECGRNVLKVCAYGLGFWLYGDRRGMKEGAQSKNPRVPPDEIANKMLNEYRAQALSVIDILGPQNQHLHMHRAPVSGAIWATSEKGVKIAHEFWDAVGSGEMLKASDPRHKLREWLRQVYIRDSGKKATWRAEPEAIFRACIHMWNHWRSGDTVRAIRSSTTGDRPTVRK